MRLLALLLVSLPAFAADYQIFDLPELDAVESTAAVSVVQRGAPAVTATFSVITAGAPSGCTLKILGSIDGTNFFDLSGDQTCTSSLMFHIVDRPVRWMKGQLTALSGGTSPTVNVKVLAMSQ